MPQIVLFILDLITSLINLFSATKGFKDKSKPSLIIEKVYIPASSPPQSKYNHKEKTSKYKNDDSDIFLFFAVAFFVLCFFIWFDLKFHDWLVIITTVLTLLTTILYVLQGSKYTLPIKKQLAHFYFFSQPLFFSIAIGFLKKSFDFATVEKKFNNVSNLKDTISLFLTDPFSLEHTALGFFHIFNSTFYIFFAIGLLFFIVTLSAQLKNRAVKFIYYDKFSMASLVFMYLLPSFVILGAVFYSVYFPYYQPH